MEWMQAGGAQPRLLLKDGTWIDFPAGEAWVLGRDSTAKGRVDVDLAPHDVVRGVSRWHARIQRLPVGYAIIDLGSTNETTLEGFRLAPHQSYPLADGGHIGLGSLRMTFYVTR